MMPDHCNNNSILITLILDRVPLVFSITFSTTSRYIGPYCIREPRILDPGNRLWIGNNPRPCVRVEFSIQDAVFNPSHPYLFNGISQLKAKL